MFISNVTSDWRMNKDIFCFIFISLVSLNIFLFLNYQNPVLLIASVVFSILFAFLNLSKTISSQEKMPYLIGRKIDLVLIILGLFFFALSRMFNRYETDLLAIGSLFALIKLIRGNSARKS